MLTDKATLSIDTLPNVTSYVFRIPCIGDITNLSKPNFCYVTIFFFTPLLFFSHFSFTFLLIYSYLPLIFKALITLFSLLLSYYKIELSSNF